VYRSESDNLLEDFYIPALTTSTRYDRAVGFFSSAMLSYAAQGVSGLLENNGSMRLIVGAELDAEEAEAIERGYEFKELSVKIGVQFLKVIDNIAEALCYKRLETLSWMIGTGALEIKVALRRRGMYHEKIGILTDEAGDQIVFEGSANETVSALLPDFNFESLNVFPCWREEFRPYFDPYLAGFDRLWNNRSKNTIVLEFPEAAKNRMIDVAKKCKVPTSEIEAEIWRDLNREEIPQDASSYPSVPKSVHGIEFHLFDHQKEALLKWRSAGWAGILELATGAGKTITALYAITKLFEASKKLFVIIAVPYQSLADQWLAEARVFGIEPIPCYDNAARWRDTLAHYVHLYNTHAQRFACVVVVNRTLQSDEFKGMISNVSGKKLLFIGDECHHLRSHRLATSLPEHAELRLGLSATPGSQYIAESDDPLYKYFGAVSYSYTLANALNDKVLTPYYYHPHFIELTDDEIVVYEELSTQIAKSFASQKASLDDPDDRLKQLLLKRARLLGSARNKLKALDELLSSKKPERFSLFYCGDGTCEHEDTGESIRQVRAVSQLIHSHGWSSSEFTAEESRQVRKTILDDFRVGLIDAMVAIRCLDEGIDVPACRTAYIMASGRNPRQFIQRRGRILRRSPGKEFAVIYDFPVQIPFGVCEKTEFERQLFKAELQRIAEFARLAENPHDSYRAAEALLKAFDLEHILV